MYVEVMNGFNGDSDGIEDVEMGRRGDDEVSVWVFIRPGIRVEYSALECPGRLRRWSPHLLSA